MPNRKQRMAGCLLGGAIGDALGYPVEFLRYNEILRQYGSLGIQELPEPALVSDDTQMTLFTAEGLLHTKTGHSRINSVYRSYLRWYYTQSKRKLPGAVYEGGLLKVPALMARRAPGSTCISSLESGVMGSMEKPINGSRGCGGVMRAAPCAAYSDAFSLGCRTAAITHGNPGGYLPAGALACLLRELYTGATLPKAVGLAIGELAGCKESERTAGALKKALELSEEKMPSVAAVSNLGEGWTGEEALSIGLYCALSYPNDYLKAIRLAVNHSGDSDSTGSICGNILGMYLGEEAIPEDWLSSIEMGDLIRGYAIQLSEPRA